MERPATGLDNVEGVLAGRARVLGDLLPDLSKLSPFVFTNFCSVVQSSSFFFSFKAFVVLGLLRELRFSAIEVSDFALPDLNTLAGVSSSLDFFSGEEWLVNV